MGRKKKKQSNPLRCGFCQIFQDIPSKKWRTEGSHTNIVRFCEYKKDYVGTTSHACLFFVPARYINCINFNRRIPTVACISRLNKKECSRCKSKKTIKEIEKILDKE